MAGCMLTPPDRRAAVPACVSRWAGAGVVIYTIPASASVGTRGGGTVVHVVLTVPPREASLAAAQVRIAKVHAFGATGAGCRTAVIHLLLTVEARVAHRAAAGIASLGVVCTTPTVEAGTICTGHGTQLTDPAIEARWAGTGVAVLEVCAAPPIPAGAGGTLISLQFAVGTCVSRPTGAGVAPLPCVGAGGPIPAGCVVCAVVQVLVTEKATPAFLAVTLPGLLAGTMETAWVTDAFVTVPALPAYSTLAFPRFVTKPMLFVTPRQADWFCAVLAFPARVAHLLASLPTCEVAEGVIPGAAEHGAALPIVVLITHEAV